MPKCWISDRNEELVEHGTPDFPCACYHNDYHNMEVPWHWHEEFEMAVVESGECWRFVGQERYLLRAGDGIFIGSGSLHQAIASENLPGTEIDVVFHGRLVYGTSSSIFYKKYVQPLLSGAIFPGLVLHADIIWQKQILDSIRRISLLFAEQPEGYEFLVREQLSHIFLLLHQNCHDLPSQKSHGRPQKYEHLKIMLNYIHHHFDQPITLDQIAASANICERECLRSFQEILGESPIQYVIRHRILHACQLLRENQLTISEISSDCGFSSTSYFSKLFRRLQGCTPREYRLR